MSYLIQDAVLLQKGDAPYFSSHLDGSLQCLDLFLHTVYSRISISDLFTPFCQLIQLHFLPVDREITPIKLLTLRQLSFGSCLNKA